MSKFQNSNFQKFKFSNKQQLIFKIAEFQNFIYPPNSRSTAPAAVMLFWSQGLGQDQGQGQGQSQGQGQVRLGLGQGQGQSQVRVRLGFGLGQGQVRVPSFYWQVLGLLVCFYHVTQQPPKAVDREFHRGVGVFLYI